MLSTHPCNRPCFRRENPTPRRTSRFAVLDNKRRGLNQRDAIGLEAFAPVDDVDANALARTERLYAAATQRRNMHEDILASAVRRNESVALVGLEPLHRSFERLCGPAAAAPAA